MSKRIWKDIKGYEGLYQVSNLGEVRSFWGFKREKMRHNIRILKPGKDRDGYLLVILYDEKTKKVCKVHHLVANAFLKPISKFTEIDHLDGVKTNNCVENLRWVSRRQNLKNRGANQKHYSTRKRAVIAIDDSKTALNFSSIREASRKLGIVSSQICKCAKGLRGSVNGYVFKYAE